MSASTIEFVSDVVLRRLALLLIAVFLLRPGAPGTAYGLAQTSETAIAITSEPHYHLLLENSQVRVFALTLPPKTQSIVRHEQNFLTVTLKDSEIILWKNGESPIQHYRVPNGEIHFFLAKSAQGIRNDSQTEYRNVTIEFLDPEVTNYGYRYESGKWDYGPSVPNPPVDPDGQFVNSLNLEKAEAKDVQLWPKQSLPRSRRTALLIAVTPVALSAGPDKKLSLNPGEVAWLENLDNGLLNLGAGRARFALVEFKSPSEKQ